MQVLQQKQVKAELKLRKLEQLQLKEKNLIKNRRNQIDANAEKQLPLSVELLTFQAKLESYIETIQSTLDKQQRLLSSFSVLSLYEIEEMNQKEIIAYYHHLFDKLEQVKAELSESIVSQTGLEKFLEQNLQEIKVYVNQNDSQLKNKKKTTKQSKIQARFDFDDEITQDYLCQTTCSQQQDQSENQSMPINLKEVSSLMKPFIIHNNLFEGYSLMGNGQRNLTLQKFEQNIKLMDQQSFLTKGECLTILGKMYQSLSLSNSIQLIELPSIEILLQRGYSLERVSNYQLALQVYDQVLQRDAYNIEALYRKGDCLRILEQYSDSLCYYEKVLMLNENHADSLWGKGCALGLQNQYEEALKYIEKALVINPNNVEIIWAKGECLRLLGQYQFALNELDRGLALNPYHIYSLCSKGECLRNLEQYSEATIFIDSAISLNPLYFFALGCKGLIYLNQQMYQIAKQFLQQTLKLNPNNISFKYGLKYCEEMLQLNK